MSKELEFLSENGHEASRDTLQEQFPLFSVERFLEEYARNLSLQQEVNRLGENTSVAIGDARECVELEEVFETERKGLVEQTVGLTKELEGHIFKVVWEEHKDFVEESPVRTIVASLGAARLVNQIMSDRSRDPKKEEIRRRLEVAASRKLEEVIVSPDVSWLAKLKVKLWDRRRLRNLQTKRGKLQLERAKQMIKGDYQGVLGSSLRIRFANSAVERMTRGILGEQTVDQIASQPVELDPLPKKVQVPIMYGVGCPVAIVSALALPFTYWAYRRKRKYEDELLAKLEEGDEWRLKVDEVGKIADRVFTEACEERGVGSYQQVDPVDTWLRNEVRQDEDCRNQAFISGALGEELGKELLRRLPNETEEEFRAYCVEIVTAHREGIRIRAMMISAVVEYLGDFVFEERGRRYRGSWNNLDCYGPVDSFERLYFEGNIRKGSLPVNLLQEDEAGKLQVNSRAVELYDKQLDYLGDEVSRLIRETGQRLNELRIHISPELIRELILRRVKDEALREMDRLPDEV